MLRLRRYNEYWRFYLGQHWAFTREDGEPLVTLNYCRRVINKIADWMVGCGMTIEVAAPLANLTKPVLDDVWKDNERDKWLYNCAILGGVTGDVFALVTYEDATVAARRRNPHTVGRIRIQLLNSEQVFCTWDPLNREVLLQVRIETLYYDTLAAQQNMPASGSNNRQLHVRRFSQIITKDWIAEQFQGGEPLERPNVLGEIALVHIQNQPVPGEFYGLSDIDGIVDLNRELNEKSTDMSDVVSYHSMPITVVTGAKVGDLERSPKQIWSGLPEGAEVFNLQASPAAGTMDYIKMIRECVLEMANIPEGSLGKQQQISNTSGAALHIQYQPLVEIRDRKRPFYVAGIQDLNYFILRAKEVVDPTFKLPTDLCASCGGRIVELLDDSDPSKPPVLSKKCYEIDPQTFDFLDPGKVDIQHVRQHSFGNQITKSPMDQVQDEHNQYAPSAWDPEPQRSAEDVEAEQAGPPQLDAQGQPIEPTPYQPPTQSKVEDLPPEPETIVVHDHEINTETGELQPVGDPQERQVVPTGCLKPRYLDPYETKVTLNDTLPKDKMVEVQYHQALITAGIASKAWCREHTPEIEDPEAEGKRVDADQKAAANMAQQAGGHAPPPSSPGGMGSPPKPPGDSSGGGSDTPLDSGAGGG